MSHIKIFLAVAFSVVILGTPCTQPTQGGASLQPATTIVHKALPPTTSTTTAFGTILKSGKAMSTPPVHRIVAPSVPTPTRAAHVSALPSSYVTPTDIAMWSRVAMCEEGGNWHVRGSKYSGGLGILNSNWTAYSRGMGLPANAADATPVQQIAVAKKINAGYAVPDQRGCGAW